MFEQRRTTAILPMLSSLLGLSFCLWIALSPLFLTGADNAAECAATGCTLYKDISIAGISLWHIGTVAFASLAFLALRGHTKLGYTVSGYMLTGDIILLVLMAFTAPCTNCLIVAAFFGLTFWLFRYAETEQLSSPIGIIQSQVNHNPQGRSWLLTIWTLFFFTNCLALANERLEPWIIHGTDKAPMRIYFSPSCPSCREAVRTYAVSGTQIAFLPVAEDDADLYAIATLQEELVKGKNFFPAFRYATNESNVKKDLTFIDYLTLQWKLLRNKVRFYASGSTTLPLIQMHGMPKTVSTNSQSNAPLRQHNSGLLPSQQHHNMQSPSGTNMDSLAPVIPMGGALHFEGCSDDTAAAPCPTD